MTKEKKSTKKAQTRSSRYHVATFEKFPGVEIPLLSEDECRARGIESGKLPPFDTWSPEQQAAFHELAEIIAQAVVDVIMQRPE
jgi:hypothetical protein